MSSQIPSLEERLNAQPQLKVRSDAVLAIVEDAHEEVKQADEAERRVIEELRRLGTEALHSWAAQQEAEQGAAVCAQGAARLAAAVLPLGGGEVSELCATAAAADGRFWCGCGVWASAGQAHRTLWDNLSCHWGSESKSAERETDFEFKTTGCHRTQRPCEGGGDRAQRGFHAFANILSEITESGRQRPFRVGLTGDHQEELTGLREPVCPLIGGGSGIGIAGGAWGEGERERFARRHIGLSAGREQAFAGRAGSGYPEVQA